MTDFYIAIDGDGVGTELKRLIKEGNTKNISNYAFGVQDEMFAFADNVKGLGAEILMCSGDSVLYVIAAAKVNHSLSFLPSSFCTYSVGVGRNLIEAHKYLNFAKLNGKKQTFWFTQKVTKRIIFNILMSPYASLKYLLS